MVPYPLSGSNAAVELRQITLTRAAAIVTGVSVFRTTAVAAGATSLYLARQRLPAGYASMLNQVEVTVAAQPLPDRKRWVPAT